MAVGVLDPRKGIVWQDDGSSLTPEQIEQLQALEVRKRMGGVDTSPVNHWSQGAARVVDALGGVLRERRLSNAAAENQAYNAEQAAPLISALSGSPVASAATSGVNQEMASTSPAPNVSPEISAGIVETANALGIDPVDLGTAISYETAGTFDPTKAGPTTQWGQHKGLIQFGEPQAQKYGVDWNNPVGSQLGPNGAVANYLRSTGVKPGMGLMDIYSAINAGGVGRYGASDANNGGAPGTVADKVNQQMAGHRAKALALLGDYGNPGNPDVAASYANRLGAPFQPQTASQAIETVAPSSGYLDPMVRVQPQAMAPELPAPVNVSSAPPVASVPQQVAQVPQTQPSNNAAIAQALRVMADPRANEGTRAVANALIQQEQRKQAAAQEQNVWMQRQQYEQQQQASDPLRQAQILQTQAQAQKLQRDAANPNGDESFYGNPVAIQNPDGTLSYGQIGNRGTFKPITLGEGQQFAPPTRTVDAGTETILTDQAGNVISRIPKQNREAAAQTAAGAVEGKTTAERGLSASADYQSAQNALDILTQIEKNPALESGTGFSSVFNRIPGSSGYDFQNLVEQAKSGAFLTAIESLRGMGSLSNAEGGAATAAVTRMDTATSKEAFEAALSDYRKIVTQGLDRAKRNMPEGQKPPEQPTQAKRLRYNPATGELE